MKNAKPNNMVTFYNKMGQGDDPNYLYISTPKSTLMISWMDMWGGIKVFTQAQFKGKTRRPPDYKIISPQRAAKVLIAALKN